jgi:hypothetical protein
MSFKIFGKDGLTEIHNLDDWARYGKPAEEKHWKKGRSAQEVANAWLPDQQPGIPSEFLALFDGYFSDELVLEKAIAEKKTRFSDTPRGPRNHDLLIHAKIGSNKVILSIEGKEREAFDKPLKLKKLDAKSPSSKLPSRIRGFCSGILGLDYDRNSEELGKLYYQLFSGVAGLAQEMKLTGADFGVFVVQQIKSSDTPETDLDRNNNSFLDFIKMVEKTQTSGATDHKDSSIWGPFELPGNELVPKAKIYLAKFTTVIK